MQDDKVSLWVEMLTSSSAEVLGMGRRDWNEGLVTACRGFAGEGEGMDWGWNLVIPVAFLPHTTAIPAFHCLQE